MSDDKKLIVFREEPTKQRSRLSNFFARALSFSNINFLNVRKKEIAAKTELLEKTTEYSVVLERAVKQEVRHKLLSTIVQNEAERVHTELNIKHAEDMHELKVRAEKVERQQNKNLEERRRNVVDDEYLHDIEIREHVIAQSRKNRELPSVKAASSLAEIEDEINEKYTKRDTKLRTQYKDDQLEEQLARNEGQRLFELQQARAKALDQGIER